jgi:Zn-dependent peptidase ImmA (M78 family)
MKTNNLQHLSKIDIEVKAEVVIEYYDKNVLHKPQFTPLMAIIKKLKDEFKIIFDFKNEIGTSLNGKKILGKFIFKPRSILVDKSIINDIRFPFVLAHELGHLVLHRKISLPKNEYDNFIDTEYDLISGRKILLSIRDWIEWQANQFASAILMPQTTLLKSIISIQKKIGIGKSLGNVYLDNTNYSQRDFKRIIGELEIIFHVNKTNIEYRMNDLGILIDRRSKNIKHMSELLKEE